MTDQEGYAVLSRRIEALEERVFGEHGRRSIRIENLADKVNKLKQHLNAAEGDAAKDLDGIIEEAAAVGLRSTAPTLPMSGDGLAVIEDMLYATRAEVEMMAKLLARVKALQQYVNPEYLRDIPAFIERLSSLESKHLVQVTDATCIREQAEQLHNQYSQAISAVSQKFVHWDDQVTASEVERER